MSIFRTWSCRACEHLCLLLKKRSWVQIWFNSCSLQSHKNTKLSSWVPQDSVFVLFNSRFCGVLFKEAVSLVIPILRTRSPWTGGVQGASGNSGRRLVPPSVSAAQPPGHPEQRIFQAPLSVPGDGRKVLKFHPDMHKCKSALVTIQTWMSRLGGVFGQDAVNGAGARWWLFRGRDWPGDSWLQGTAPSPAPTLPGQPGRVSELLDGHFTRKRGGLTCKKKMRSKGSALPCSWLGYPCPTQRPRGWHWRVPGASR